MDTTTPIIIGYKINGVQEDVLKAPTEPSDQFKWGLIQRLFLIMMDIYNMGKKGRQ